MNTSTPWIFTLTAVLAWLGGGMKLAAEEAPPMPDPAGHTVIVPYDATKPLRLSQPNRFYLDYADFQRLWEMAKENRMPAKAVTESGDSDAFITSALYEAEVIDTGLRVKARFDVVSRGANWANLALLFRSEKGTLAVSSLTLDGHAAAYSEGAVIIEKAGAHTIEVALEITLERAWKAVNLELPSASAAALSLTVPGTDGRPLFGGGQGRLVTEESREGRRTFTLPLENPTRVMFTRNPALRLVADAAPAQVETGVSLRVLPRLETVAAKSQFRFPGTERRSVSVELDPTLRLRWATSAPDGTVTLRKEGNRQFLDAVFTQSVADAASISFTAVRAFDDGAAYGARQAPFVRGVAARESTVLNLMAAEQLSVRPDAAATAERTQPTAPVAPREAAVGAWRLAMGSTFSYVVGAAEDRSIARIEMLQQLSAQKTEVICALVLDSGRGPLADARVGIPAGFEVQSVSGPRVQSWHRSGDELLVRFDSQPDREARLVLYLTKTLPQAPATWTLEPLKLPQFVKQETVVLIVANAADEVKLTFDAADRKMREEDPRTVRKDTTVQAPMEVKRALRVERPDWTAQVALSRQAPRFSVDAVLLAQAGDLGLRLSQQIGVVLDQGAVNFIKVRMRGDLPEARVNGPTVRDVQSRLVDGVREYTVGFQTEVHDRVDFTLDLDLPLEGEKTLPVVQVEGAARIQRYAIVDNAGAREMKVDHGGANSVAQQAIPWLPDGLTRPQYFRLPDQAAIKVSLTQLESTAGNAAIVTLAEITTALRTDGDRWEMVVYSLANRSLQFLPVRLPERAELVEVSVGGQTVRADRAKSLDPKKPLSDFYLVPLIQMRAGEMSQQVKLVYRVPGGGRGVEARHGLDDPELIGLSAERTLWNVWVPDGYEAKGFGGNMDEVGEEGHDLEKQRSLLSEVSRLNRVLASKDADYTDAKLAMDNANKALKQLGDLNAARKGKPIAGEGDGDGAQAKNVQVLQADVDKQIAEQSVVLTSNLGNVSQLELKERTKSQMSQLPGQGQVVTSGALVNNWASNGAATQSYTGGTVVTGTAGTVVTGQQATQLFNDNAGVNNDFFIQKSGGGSLVISGGVLQAPQGNWNLSGANTFGNARGNRSGQMPLEQMEGTVAAIVDRELVRRSARVQEAVDAIDKGNDLLAAGDLEGARSQYRVGQDLLPDSPLTEALRKTAAEKLNEANVELARERAKNGRYDDARALLKETLAQNQGNADAGRLLKELDDPDRYEPALTPEHLKNVQEVEQQLKLGYSYYNLGDFDKSRKSFQDALRVDPYNSAARRGMERAEAKRSEYFDAARDNLRAKMLNEVNKGGESPVPSSLPIASSGNRFGGSVALTPQPGMPPPATISGVISAPADPFGSDAPRFPPVPNPATSLNVPMNRTVSNSAVRPALPPPSTPAPLGTTGAPIAPAAQPVAPPVPYQQRDGFDNQKLTFTDSRITPGSLTAGAPGNLRVPPSFAPQAAAFVDLNEPVLRPAQPLTPQLKPVGRVSLAIDVPLSGTVFHFSKLKDHAALEITIVKPWDPARRTALVVLVSALAILFVVRFVRGWRMARPA